MPTAGLAFGDQPDLPGEQEVVITGRSSGAEVIRLTQYAYLTMDVDPVWDLRPTR